MITHATDTVAVWLERGVPARLVWRGERYTVSDTPTPLRGSAEAVPDWITHPPEPIIGWRFQGTNAHGEAHVFDVRKNTRAEWELIKIYD